MVCVCRRWVWGGGGHARCGTDFDIFQAQGRLGEAEALYARAFAVGGAALGPRHPDVAVWCSNLAGLFQVRSFVCARARASLSASFLSPSLSLSASSFSLRFASPLCRPWGVPGGRTGGRSDRPWALSHVPFRDTSRCSALHLRPVASPLTHLLSGARPLRRGRAAVRAERLDPRGRSMCLAPPALPPLAPIPPPRARSLARIRATRVSRATAGDRRLY
jgi:hypothetical protein